MSENGKKGLLPSFSIIIVFITLILSGLPLIYLLNFELYPNTGSSSLTINFSWENAEPEVIEEKVTSRLEAMTAQVQGITKINSRSGNSAGRISIYLDKDADIDAVRFQISTLIRQIWADLPEGVRYPELSANYPDRENERPFLSYTLSAPVTLPVVRDYADNNIKIPLSSIAGVNKVDINGGSVFEWVVVYDFDKLEALGIVPGDISNSVSDAISKENLGTGLYNGQKVFLRNYTTNSGSIEVPVLLKRGGTIGNIENYLLSIPVKRCADRVIYLKDIAKIWYREEGQFYHYRINGLNTINILIYPGADVNNLVLAKNVKQTMQILENKLPAGYELILGEDSTRYISQELHNILLRSLFALIILMLFIFLVTRKWGYAFMVLIMLMGNLSIAVIFYYIFKLELHLYALAGITVSLGLMTDNIIIMTDHYRKHGNRKAFVAILAGTMAVIASLLIIFFLEEKIKANLVDFAMVVIINQAVSLFTALFVIPAISDKMGLKKPENENNLPVLTRKNKLSLKLSILYVKAFRIIHKRKVIFVIILVLSFGTPIYLLPDKMDGERWINKVYNSTLGNENYKTNIKPLVDKSLGGTLRLFTEKVFTGSYFSNPEETSLFISATFPRGTTLNQADMLMTKMEDFLRKYKEISLFSSNITPRNSSISVYFKEKFRRSEFPYILKTDVVNKAVEMGGAYWSVQGFGDAFSNSVYETTGNYAVKVAGYNYDRLLQLASDLRTNLAKYERVKEIFIVSERSWYKPDNTEFIAEVNNELSEAYSDLGLAYSNLQNWSIKQPGFNAVINGTKRENIRLIPDDYITTDLWRLAHLPIKRDSAFYRFGNSFDIKKQTTSSVISREDQQYIMFLQFEFVGAEKTARNYINKTIEDFKDQIPIGYSASLLPDNRFLWNDQDKDQYWLLLLVIVIIFFICSVLFESLLQPFAVILIIPVSYIGIFLTFYVFRLNFDQGGFAALLMLSGLTVNAALYILNDYNNLKKTHPSDNGFILYLKAFNNKIIPILLTVVSTVLGFVPFLIGERQPFWFPLAAGTIGGLVFSLIGLIIYLPLFLGLKDKIIIRKK